VGIPRNLTVGGNRWRGAGVRLTIVDSGGGEVLLGVR
jgi:hypothetical protein